MDLYTRCAQCSTIFRVTTQQLQASAGRVHCGQCQQVFDAFASLTVQQPDASAHRAHQGAEQPAVATPAQEPIIPAGSRSPARPKPPLRPDPAAALYEWEFKMPQPSRHRARWTVMALVSLVTLALQAAYAFRTDIMISVPQSRGYYQRVCELSGCKLSPPKLASYLHIETSDLKADDPARAGELQLWLTVRNRAPVDLAYPAFELTLTDAMEQAIGRRVFLPAQYLPAGAQAAGFKAGAEVPIHLYLDVGALRPSGYRLYLFYP